MYRTLLATCGSAERFLFLYHFPFSLGPHVASNVRYIAFAIKVRWGIFAEPLLYENFAAAASGMLDEADLRVNLLADLRGVADHAYLAALGGL